MSVHKREEKITFKKYLMNYSDNFFSNQPKKSAYKKLSLIKKPAESGTILKSNKTLEQKVSIFKSCHGEVLKRSWCISYQVYCQNTHVIKLRTMIIFKDLANRTRFLSVYIWADQINKRKNEINEKPTRRVTIRNKIP